jgi:ubiquinone/menaquinone biosynthesis C-methylase UbiE
VPPSARGERLKALRREVRATYDGLAHEYERRWHRYLAGSLGATAEALGPLAGRRVLDVGCGTGWLLRDLLGSDADGWGAGVDPSAEMVRLAAAGAGHHAAFALADAGSLPFADRAFDAVVSSNSLHHWDEPERALAELARVTAPRGTLVITDWCRDVPLFRPYAFLLPALDRTVHRVYSLAELQRLVGQAGFSVRVARRYRVAVFWGMMTLVALRAR